MLTDVVLLDALDFRAMALAHLAMGRVRVLPDLFGQSEELVELLADQAQHALGLLFSVESHIVQRRLNEVDDLVGVVADLL